MSPVHNNFDWRAAANLARCQKCGHIFGIGAKNAVTYLVSVLFLWLHFGYQYSTVTAYSALVPYMRLQIILIGVRYDGFGATDVVAS
jgi:hypothetical protein